MSVESLGVSWSCTSLRLTVQLCGSVRRHRREPAGIRTQLWSFMHMVQTAAPLNETTHSDKGKVENTSPKQLLNKNSSTIQ